MDLLRSLVPDRNELPPGVEIAYDRHSGVHALRFLAAETSHVPDPFSFLAATLVGRHAARSCPYFPEEFSLLFTLKMSDRRKLKTAEVAQCLFAISRRGTPLSRLMTAV